MNDSIFNEIMIFTGVPLFTTYVYFRIHKKSFVHYYYEPGYVITMAFVYGSLMYRLSKFRLMPLKYTSLFL